VTEVCEERVGDNVVLSAEVVDALGKSLAQLKANSRRDLRRDLYDAGAICDIPGRGERNG
jgi:hypothetical protein